MLHIFKAYSYCISLLSRCCLLLFGSWVDLWSFGSVFVRFLPVLEWSEECFGMFFGSLGGSWAAPGRSWVGLGRSRALLGRSWPILGRSWLVLGRSWLVLGRSWLVLGRSWGGLGPVLGRSWALLGRSWPLLEGSWVLLAGPWGTKIDFPAVLVANIECSKNTEKTTT